MTRDTPLPWQRLRPVLEAVLDAEAEGKDRNEVLQRLAGADPELKAAVQALLVAESEHADWLERPIGARMPGLVAEAGLIDPELQPGDRVDRYRVIEPAGRGGMGVVYRAERCEGPIRLEVALKVVMPAMGGPRMEQRLRTECSILAQLSHPHIARLIDFGSLADGRTFLAVEFVHGEPLDRYCNRMALGIPARLELLLAFCESVDFAHQRLIVHRDIKPSNMLVTAQGEVRLLDFGIAHVLDEARDDGAGLARFSHSPGYASPEQLRGDAVTTATDVYSLGVVLHELVTGVLPPQCVPLGGRYDARYASWTGLGHPQLGLHAARCGLSESALRRHLRSDLGDIVHRALAAEPSRRYRGPAALAADLRRHLAGRPVAARQGGPVYVLGRWMARHRRLALAAAIAVVSLTAGVSAAIWQAREATAERDRTLHARTEAELHRQTLIETILTAEQMASDEAGASTAALIDEQARRIRQRVDIDEPTRASRLELLADTYATLGHAKAAANLLDEVVEGRRRQATAAETLAALLLKLGTWRVQSGDAERGEPILREAAALYQRLHGLAHPDTARAILRLSYAVGLRGGGDETLRLRLTALDLMRQLHRPPHPDLAQALNDLGRSYRFRGIYPRALALLEESLAMRRALQPQPDASWSAPLTNLTLVHLDMGDVERAEASALSLVEVRSSISRIAAARSGALGHLAKVRLAQGRMEDAVTLYTEALHSRPGDHYRSSEERVEFADALRRLGRLDEAESQVQRAMHSLAAHLGEQHWRYGEARSVLGAVRVTGGRREEGLELLREGLAIVLGQLPEASPVSVQARRRLIDAGGELKDAERR